MRYILFGVTISSVYQSISFFVLCNFLLCREYGFIYRTRIFRLNPKSNYESVLSLTGQVKPNLLLNICQLFSVNILSKFVYSIIFCVRFLLFHIWNYFKLFLSWFFKELGFFYNVISWNVWILLLYFLYFYFLRLF